MATPDDSRLFLARDRAHRRDQRVPRDRLRARALPPRPGRRPRAARPRTGSSASICCSYDDPTNNTAATHRPVCNVDRRRVRADDPGQAAADDARRVHQLRGLVRPAAARRRCAVRLRQAGARYVRWLDGHETNFRDDTSAGRRLQSPRGGDCELRGTGPTPLAGSLHAAEDYLAPIRTHRRRRERAATTR